MVDEDKLNQLIKIYTNYTRVNSELYGAFVYRLEIDSGKATDAHLISSELKQASLEKKLVDAIKTFRFPNILSKTTLTDEIFFVPF